VQLRAAVRGMLHQVTAPSTPERRRARRRSWTWQVALADVGLALVLDLATVHSVWREHHGPAVWVLDQALVLPVALRRRHPAAVFSALAVLASVQWAYRLALPADGSLLLALYTVAAHETRARAMAAAAVLETGVVLASLRFAPTGDGVIGSLIFLTGLVAAAYLLGTSVRGRRDYLAALEDRARRLEIERDQQARLIQVAERTRIAREMHDIVSHNLSVMITLAAGAAATASTGPAEAARAMDQVAVTGRAALAEMRRLLGVLREDAPPTGIAPPQPGLDQLDELLEQVRGTGLPVQLRVRGRPRPVPGTTQLTLYRAVQEALTNTRKHARGATRASVTFTWRPTGLDLVITDDGARPASVPASAPLPALPWATPATGMGLAGMRERVSAAGGTMTARPGPVAGWRVQVRLPLGPAEPA
jgi:signal transduction histidine kinase